MKRRSLILLYILVLSIVVSNVFAVQQASVHVQMYNANLAAQINTIYPWYRITNTGSTPVNLSDVKIRYFYTIDGEKPQIFRCDWSSAGSANVTGTFVKMKAPFSGADYYFELGFKTSAGYLQPGKSIEVQSRFYKNDWSNYNQTNDYSFNPTSQKYVDWEKIAVQIGEGTAEDFVTSSDFTKDNQWLQEAVAIHLRVTGNGSENATTYYSINDGETMNGKVITINDDGIYKVSFWSKGKTSYTEVPHQITVKIDRNAPIVTGTIEPVPNANGWLKSDATVTFSATDALSGVASVSPPVFVTTEGVGQVVKGEAKDNLGNTSTTSVTINIDKTPPVISELYPKSGSVINQTLPVIAANISDNLSGIDASTVKMTVDGREVTVSFENGQAIYTPANTLEVGIHTVKLHVSDKAGNPSTEVSSTFTVDSTLPNLPPDPATVAPKLDPTVCTSMLDATKFLYTGENPIQTGVAEETIEARRAAVLRGKVLDKDGQPLPGVKITVLNHPEYGQTYSRADGMFDLAVNGGGYLTVKYERAGYLSAQRQVNVPWKDYAWLSDVCLVQADLQVSEIKLGTTLEAQVARGSAITDKDGTRQAVIIFPEGLQVNGYSGTSLHIRATEYTVGENGKKMMPADLPPTSGYTYCVDLSADELNHVEFNKPVVVYIENFLDFPVGGVVPSGYYDREAGHWVPSDNGRVIRILNIDSDGLAVLDVYGYGVPADVELLNQLGITDSECRQLAILYSSGQGLWRVPVKHFSPWDFNWPYGFPNGAKGPGQGPLGSGQPLDKNCDIYGHSTIEVQNQILKESIGVVGTPLTISYSSERVPGHRAAASVAIPLSGTEVPTPLKRIDLEVEISGQKHVYSFSPQTSLGYSFNWDGNDGYGRTVRGSQPLTVRVGYVYDAVYKGALDVPKSFGLTSDVSAYKTRGEVTAWQVYNQDIDVGYLDARSIGIAGWDINIHHYYDVKSQTLYLGDGKRRKLNDKAIETISGNGSSQSSGDGVPAAYAGIGIVEDIEFGPDGNIYFLSWDSVIHKIDSDGNIITVAGQPDQYGYNGDGIPAKDAIFNGARDMAFGPDGCLYITDTRNCRIRKIDKNGIIWTVAGTGEDNLSGDNGPAINAAISPMNICFSQDGSMYFTQGMEQGNGVIRRITSDGIISAIPGSYYQLGILCVGPDGSLYIQENNQRVLCLGVDGSLETIAGNGQNPGDGIPAAEASIGPIGGMFVGSDGRIFLTDAVRNLVRVIGTDKTIRTLAGTGDAGFSGDGGLATQSQLNYPRAVASGPDGTLFVGDGSNYRLRSISSSSIPRTQDKHYIIPSEEGQEIYIFDATGRHLQTMDALTGLTVYTFSYEIHGYLSSITDCYGNITRIERDSQGSPTAIVGPFGQRTTLELDTDGYLRKVTNPANESAILTYHPGGLLATLTDPRNNISHYAYDPMGNLIRDEGADGSYIELSRTSFANGFEVVAKEGLTNDTCKISTYRVEYEPNGDTRWISIGCCGGPTETVFYKDGSEKVIKPDGTVINTTKGPDPRFGMLAPNIKSVTITTPGELKYTQSENRVIKLFDDKDILNIKTETVSTTVNGKTSTSFYDAATHMVTSTSPEGRKTATTIDEKGRVVKMEVPGLVPVTFEYDTHGRLYRTTQGSGADARISSIAYNAGGWVESVTDPLLQITSFEYDAVGRVKKQILPDGKVIQFNYDSNGNMTTLTPPGKPEHGFSYNNVNLTDKYTPPTVTNGGETSYEYNLAKQPTLVTRPDGKTIGFEYDTMGRLVTLKLPDGEIAYTYDATTGNLKNVIGRDGGAISYTYDGGFTTNTTWNGTVKGSVEFIYNNDFQIQSQSVNDGFKVNLGYDNDDLLTSIGDLTIARNPETGQVTGTTIGNVTDTLTYNSFGEVTDYQVKSSENSIYNSHYVFNKIGGITEKTEEINGISTTYSYTYDEVGRLTYVYQNGTLASQYEYDDNGNRIAFFGNKGNLLGTEIVYDGQDRLVQNGENHYKYTANGEMEEKIVGNKVTCYTYDGLGNIKSVELPDGTMIEYILDGNARRVGKKINGALVQGFLYQDDLHPVAELDGSGNVIARFVYGISTDVPEYMVKNGTTYRIISDHLGSPRVVINVTTGEVVQSLDYDEFGNVTLDTNPGFQPFGYAGGIYEKDTELVRFGARDYDAEIGRWLSKDPIGFGGESTNLYQYADNDPINLVDPSGLLTIPFVGWVDCGENAGQNASMYWAGISIDPNRPWYQRWGATGAGVVASLWTPCTSDNTFTVLTTAAGLAGGARAAGTKAAGKEFSHWIPKRFGGPRSIWNGNYVSKAYHALSDPYRYRFMPKAWKMANSIANPVVRQIMRIPFVYTGTGAGLAVGASTQAGHK